MTDFYPSPDRFNWPIIINSSNKKISVIEDPGGANETTFTTSVTESDVLIGTNVQYYAVGSADTASKSGAGNVTVQDGADNTVNVRPLYDEICKSLTNASAADGTNSLTYQIKAITPSGSDQTKSGIQLTTSGGSVAIQLDFSASNALNPRFFGFVSGKSNKTSSGTTIDGPLSRWGSWQSPVGRAHDKRHTSKQETFRSSPEPYRAKTWRFTQLQRVRQIQYIGVAGVHIWPYAYDRQDRQTEADRGGLPLNDWNNALWDLWQEGAYSDYKILATFNNADTGLGAELNTLTDGSMQIGALTGEFASSFAPQEQTDREHAGEKYDITIPLAMAPTDDYPIGVSDEYEH